VSGPIKQNSLRRGALHVLVRLYPIEPPFKGPDHAVLAGGVKPPLPCVEQSCYHSSIIFDEMVFLVRLLINAAALWVAVQLVDGIDHRGSVWSLLFVALVFGVLNASIRPVLKLLSLPLLILTLGLFMFVINALMLMLTGWVSGLFNLGFYVAGFWDAFVGALIISVVSLVLSVLTGARKMKVHAESRTLHS
jgi:putative membrane protein